MLNHNYIGTEHVLLGLIHEGEGVAAKALESLGISLEAVRSQVEEIIGQGQAAPTGHIPFTPRAKKVLELSLREALQLGHNYIGTEHILLGLIREGEGVAAQVLQKLGADLNRVRTQVIELLSGVRDADVLEPMIPILSTSAREVLEHAAKAARNLDHPFIEPVDILLGLVVGSDEPVMSLLAQLGIDTYRVQKRIEELAAEQKDEEDSE